MMVRTAAWISYTHEPWGLTFYYPADWQLVAPDFEVLAQPPKDLPEGYTFNPDMDVLRTIGHGLTLYPPNSGPAGGVKIEIDLEEFLLSSETTLEEWVLLDRAYDTAGLGNPQTAQTSYRSEAPPVEQWPSDAAQFLHQIGEREGFRGDVYWIAVGELVYTVSTVDAGDDVLAQLRQMIASFAFDKAVQEKLRATAPFSGSEQEMIRLTERLAPPQSETCDIVCRDQKAMEQTLAEPPEELAPPGAPAEADQPSMNQKDWLANWFKMMLSLFARCCSFSSQPSSPLALLPTLTPAPTLPEPVPTPGGVVIHQGVGRDSFDWRPIPFEISYDPAIWRYVEEDPYRPRVLLHRLDEQCYLWPECCAIGADPIGPVELAGYTWTLYDSGDGIMYALWRGEEFYLFAIPVLQSGPLADGQCRVEAEKVIDTFVILEEEQK
jgi:hypothetical protein